MTYRPAINKPVITTLLGLLVIFVLVLAVQRSGETVRPEFELPELSDVDFDWIATRIYQNEAAGQSRYLAWWGDGEDFPSFGIGHFIWFPTGVDAPFDEMFPDMIAFVQQRSPNNLPVPGWLRNLTPFDAPWTDKQQFDQALYLADMTELRRWLEATKQQQSRFIVSTFEQRWRDLALPAEQYQHMTMLLQKMAATREGLFAVVDYYNFKGLGINPRERYQGQGWGLIQVLEALLQADNSGADGKHDKLVEQFRQAAESRLRLRVNLSPTDRNESRWLDGWLKRLQGYVEIDPRE